MILLSLDVSTKSGYAVFIDGELRHWGTVFPDKTVKDFGIYPKNFAVCAHHIVDRLWVEAVLPYTDREFEVVIEETNRGKNSLSQRLLEFLHFCLIEKFLTIGVMPKYIRTGEWRKIVNARLSPEEKALNIQISKFKRQTGEKLAKVNGKVVGKKGKKHVAIRLVKELYGIELARKSEDAADAILLGTAYLKGAEICDGTNKKKV